MTPFELADNLRSNKKYIMGEEVDERTYESLSFMVNRALSYQRDSLPYAQEMNMFPSLPGRLQYDYLYNSIRPNKTKDRMKWGKKLKGDDIDLIMEYFSYSRRRALEVRELLNSKQISYIREKLHRG